MIDEKGVLLELKKEMTVAEVPAIVSKFINAQRGVKVEDKGKFCSWAELTAQKIPLLVLKSRILVLNGIINNSEPGINSDVMFRFTTEDDVIEFTWSDAKNLIVEAILQRQKHPKYKSKLIELQKATEKRDMQTITKLSKELAI
jgi:hypothetical protein